MRRNHYADNWEWEALSDAVNDIMPLDAPISYPHDEYDRLTTDIVLDDLMAMFEEHYKAQRRSSAI